MTGVRASRYAGRSSRTPRVDDVGEVEVWSAWTPPTGPLGDGLACLDEAELERAAAFSFERDRVRFVRSHAFLRRVLASYLDVEPARVRIGRSSSGKPRLDPSCGISFSLSHSEDVTVVAVTRGGRVGVDVERLRRVDDALEIAEGMFTDREAELVRSASSAARSTEFLELWTRKESVVKALGGGLSIPLDAFEAVGGQGGWVTPPRSRQRAVPFAVAGFDAPDGYVGAVTLIGPRVTVRHMDPALVA